MGKKTILKLGCASKSFLATQYLKKKMFYLDVLYILSISSFRVQLLT